MTGGRPHVVQCPNDWRILCEHFELPDGHNSTATMNIVDMDDVRLPNLQNALDIACLKGKPSIRIGHGEIPCRDHLSKLLP